MAFISGSPVASLPEVDEVADAPQQGEPTEKENSEDVHYKMWAKMGSSFVACTEAVEILPSGQYNIGQMPDGTFVYSKSATAFDDIISLPEGSAESIINRIEDFWSKEHLFRQYGYLWKRGVLLHGPPGSGKTSVVQLISQRIIRDNGISIYVNNPDITAAGLKLLREIEPNRPLVVIMEDIDTLIERYGEACVLSLLDGELQVDNVVFIATTNYPEKLDGRIKNRPSRFDIVEYVGMPNKASRREYIVHTMEKADVKIDFDIDHWVDVTAGISLAHIKEVLILVQIFGLDIDTAVSRINNMIEANPTSEDYEGKRQTIGFVD